MLQEGLVHHLKKDFRSLQTKLLGQELIITMFRL